MILGFLERTVFANKLVDEARLVEENALFALEIPSFLWSNSDGVATTSTATTCALLPPSISFYYQIVAITFFQSIFNAIVGLLLFKVVIEPQQQQQQAKRFEARDASSKGAKAAAAAAAAAATATTRTAPVQPGGWLFALGIALPCVVLEPLLAVRLLRIENAGLIMTFLATAVSNSLRVLEAAGGFSPAPATNNLWNYSVYYSCSFGVDFDPRTSRARPVSKGFVARRVATLARDFVFVCLLLSALRPKGFEAFETRTEVDAMDHGPLEMISRAHLANNFLVALLLSSTLSQASLGIGLLYNLVYGVETYEMVRNPMLLSRSPSEFWGRRWNLVIHNGLKNGVYKPTRHQTSSKLCAVAATFVVSGILHEYVNFVMFQGYNNNNYDDDDDNTNVGATTNNSSIIDGSASSYQLRWKQMIFFGWNGVLVGLEYLIGHWSFFRWLSRVLPPVAVTALVLCSALPLAHLFTGDWIKRGYFDAIAHAEFLVLCRKG